MIKDIKNYETLYYADTDGNIYSKDRIISMKNPNKKTNTNITFIKKGICLKPHKKKNGYYVVTLCKNGKKEEVLVHRIIAQTFLPNPKNLPEVNHKDENPENNKLSNLEWCTRNYNYFYGTATERRKNNQPSKSVIQFDKNNYFLNKYSSIHEAERITGVKHYNIITVCKGKRKTAGGFIWKYENY